MQPLCQLSLHEAFLQPRFVLHQVALQRACAVHGRVWFKNKDVDFIEHSREDLPTYLKPGFW